MAYLWSGRILEVVAEDEDLSDGPRLAFPGVCPGRPLSESTHVKPLRELGFDAMTHGFRSSGRDYAADRDVLERRRELMES